MENYFVIKKDHKFPPEYWEGRYDDEWTVNRNHAMKFYNRQELMDYLKDIESRPEDDADVIGDRLRGSALVIEEIFEIPYREL